MGANDPLLKDLLKEAPAGALRQPRPVPAPIAEPAPAPVRRAKRSDSIGYPEGVAALAVFGAGWVADGYFSLLGLQSIGLPIDAALAWPWALTINQALAWLIPVGIEVIEQKLIGARGWGLAVFLAVAIPNALVAALGLAARFGADVGIMWPESIIWALAGTALAFAPGRGAVWAIKAMLKG